MLSTLTPSSLKNIVKSGIVQIRYPTPLISFHLKYRLVLANIRQYQSTFKFTFIFQDGTGQIPDYDFSF